MLVGGQAETLTVEVSPSNASDTTVIWESSDPSVATVEDGVVTAVGMGVASISVKTADEVYEDVCEVTVWNSCGDDAKWRVENTSTLIIAGEGAISDSASAVKQPWASVKAKITTVQIGSGITVIGKYAFAMFARLCTAQKFDFLFTASSGPGDKDSKGLIVPRFGKKPENHVAVGMTWDALAELLLITKTHYEAWLAAWYLSQIQAANPQPPAKTRKAPEIPAQQPEPAIQSQYVMPEYSGKSLF